MQSLLISKVVAALVCAALVHAATVEATLGKDFGKSTLIGKGKLGDDFGGKGKLGKLGGLSIATIGKGKVLEYPPAPEDWAAGTCTGYAFCVPGNIPPTFAAAAASCPPGFAMDDSGMCSQEQSACMLGTQEVPGKGCCIEKVSPVCYASMDACPGDCATLGTVCSPSKLYLDVFSQVQLQNVQNPTGKEAATGGAFFELLLPKFDLGKGCVVGGKGAAMEKKVIQISAAQLGKGKGIEKVQVVPKCFSKCCKQESELLCGPPKVKKLAVPALMSCPDNCPIKAGLGQCVCSAGGPAPCPPGTTECSSIGGRICVSDALCFGIDQCKVANLLMPHLVAVGCPGAGTTAAAAAASAGKAGGKAAAVATATAKGK